MTLTYTRYPVDPTGINPDNKVAGEIHTLQTTSIRAVATTYGPFFTESLVVRDNGNGSVLIKGTDYSVVELLQEATLRFGKEIAMLVLITNPAVSNSVSLDYQNLGGPYQNTAQGVVDMYNALVLDDRPVDWMNVNNKQVEYPPTLHRHFLEDVYGFEPVVVMLERIRNAMVLSDVPAFEALIDWVKSYVENSPVVSEADIETMTPSGKLVSYERLLYALDKHNFNAVTVGTGIKSVGNGGVVDYTVSCSNVPENSVLYWTIEHFGTVPGDFPLQAGLINISSGQGSFNVFVNRASSVILPQLGFRVHLRRNGATGPILATTGLVNIRQNKSTKASSARILVGCCINEANIRPTPRSYFILGDR